MFSKIRGCYDNIGLPKGSRDLLFFSANKSQAAQGDSDGKGSEQGKSFRDERSEYEAKPNEKTLSQLGREIGIFFGSIILAVYILFLILRLYL